MIVVDASLAVKWLFFEAQSEQALNLLRRQEGQLAAPDFFYIEVASAIVRKGNEFKPYRQSALQALETWTQTHSGRVVSSYDMTPERLREAGGLALEIGHPLKDCLYLALAMELDCDLVTCDARFRDKARPLGAKVVLLDEWAART